MGTQAVNESQPEPELAELVKLLHPDLNRHERRVEIRRLKRQARRSIRAQSRGGRTGMG